jgi:hypothetical protein
MPKTKSCKKRAKFSLDEIIQLEKGTVRKPDINNLPASTRTCCVNVTNPQSTFFTELPKLKNLCSSWLTSSRAFNGDECNRVDTINPDQCEVFNAKRSKSSREKSPEFQQSPIGSERRKDMEPESESWDANTWSYDSDLISLLYTLGSWIGSGESGYVDPKTLRWISTTNRDG